MEKFLKSKMEKQQNKEKSNKSKKLEVVIPEHEFKITFSRSRGPGGQNINKRATKAMLFFNIPQSHVLTRQQKQKIICAYPKEIDKQGTLILTSQETRSQEQNKQTVIRKLHNRIHSALKPVKKRIPTKTPQKAIQQRLQEKKKTAEKKIRRRKVGIDFEE